MVCKNEKCGCGGTFVYQQDKFDDYFQCIVEVYQCANCNYIWHKIKEEKEK